MKTETVAQPTVKAITPATEVIVIPPAISPVNNRRYKLTSKPAENWKGAQRRIVYNILVQNKGPMTPTEVEPLAKAAGLVSVTPVLASVRYHLHNLMKDGFVEVVN